MVKGLPPVLGAIVVALAFAGCTDGPGSGSKDDASALPPAVSTDAAPVDGTPGTIVGKVTNGTGPLPGAQATMRELSRSATSNASGEFRFDDVPNGTYELVVELFAYVTVKVPVVLQPEETKRIDIVLKRVETLTSRIEKWTFDGFMVCGVGAAEQAVNCPGAPPDTAPQLDRADEFNFTMRALGFESVVIEVLWTPALSSANGICFEVVILGTQDYEPCGDGGRILWRSDKADEPGVAPKAGEEADVLLTFFAAWENAQGQLAANAQVQQSFVVHVHAFYGVPAPTDYSPAGNA